MVILKNFLKTLNKKYPNSKLLGKTNKGNLVFEEGFVKTKITISGTVI